MIVKKRLPLKIWVAAFFRNQQWFYLRIVGARGGTAAVACPICMEELASGAIQPFVGVRTEIVALRLQKICGQAVGGVSVKNSSAPPSSRAPERRKRQPPLRLLRHAGMSVSIVALKYGSSRRFDNSGFLSYASLILPRKTERMMQPPRHMSAMPP